MNSINAHTYTSVHPKSEIFNAGTRMTMNIYHSVGIHPWESDQYDAVQFTNQLQANMKDACLAVGEVGLDKLQGPTLEVQKNCLIPQLKFAKKNNLPVIIHCVRAWEDIKALKEKIQPSQPWIFHGFAKATITEEVIASGFVISLGAYISKHPKATEIIKQIPDDKLLLETDESEIDIEEVYSFVAKAKGISVEKLQKIIADNVSNTFPKWKKEMA